MLGGGGGEAFKPWFNVFTYFLMKLSTLPKLITEQMHFSDVLYDTKSATSDLDWTLEPAYNGVSVVMF